MSLSFEYCVHISCPEASYRVWCVCVLKPSTMRRSRPTGLSSLDKMNSYKKASVTKTNQLLLYHESVTVYPNSHIKFVNKLSKRIKKSHSNVEE